MTAARRVANLGGSIAAITGAYRLEERCVKHIDDNEMNLFICAARPTVAVGLARDGQKSHGSPHSATAGLPEAGGPAR